MKSLILITLIGTVSITQSNPIEVKCPEDNHFAMAVAHGIHAIKLNDIQFFFDKTFDKIDNGIPTTNPNLDDEKHPVLDNAIDFKSEFNHIGLQGMDYIMSHNSPSFYIRKANALEKVSHELHMQEVWAAASEVYKDYVKNPPSCQCLQEDLIKKLLITTASSISAGRPYNIYAYGKQGEYQIKLGNLEGPDEWADLKALELESRPSEQEIKHLARYIYCKINSF